MTRRSFSKSLVEGLIFSILSLLVSGTVFPQEHYSAVELGALLLAGIALASLSKFDEIPRFVAVMTILCAVGIFYLFQATNVKALWFGTIAGICMFNLGIVGLSALRPLDIIAVLIGAAAFLLLGLLPGVSTFLVFTFIRFTPSSAWFAVVAGAGTGAIAGIVLSLLPSTLIRGYHLTSRTAHQQGFVTLIPGCVFGALFGLLSGIHTLHSGAVPNLLQVTPSTSTSLVEGVWLVLFGIVAGTMISEPIQHCLRYFGKRSCHGDVID